MSSEQILSQLRKFLLGLALFMFGGSLLELYLINHFETISQIIPFALSILGMLAIGWALFAANQVSLRLLQTIMLITAAGSAYGVYAHVSGNLAFELEIRPNAVAGDVLLEAFSGANPLLAPGAIGMAAIIALAAVYQHPRLK